MPTRRRRCQPRSRKTLLDYPQLCCRRPSTPPTRVNNFKATDMPTVSKVIHTDNQLHAVQFGKTAYTGWILRQRIGAGFAKAFTQTFTMTVIMRRSLGETTRAFSVSFPTWKTRTQFQPARDPSRRSRIAAKDARIRIICNRLAASLIEHDLSESRHPPSDQLSAGFSEIKLWLTPDRADAPDPAATR